MRILSLQDVKTISANKLSAEVIRKCAAMWRTLHPQISSATFATLLLRSCHLLPAFRDCQPALSQHRARSLLYSPTCCEGLCIQGWLILAHHPNMCMEARYLPVVVPILIAT